MSDEPGAAMIAELEERVGAKVWRRRRKHGRADIRAGAGRRRAGGKPAADTGELRKKERDRGK